MNKMLFGLAGLCLIGAVVAGFFALRTSTSISSERGNYQHHNPDLSQNQTAGSYTNDDQTSATASSTFSMAEVSMHNSAASCYTVINDDVYDLTNFINRHPGGQAAILSLCGRDGTAAFEAQHGGQKRQESELAAHLIGTLAN